MVRICGFVLFPLLLGLGARADDKPAKEIDKTSLKAYILKTQGRQAYGLYIQNKKIGWMISETKLAQLDNKEVALSAEEFYVKVNRDGDDLVMESKGSTWFSLEGDGEVLRIEDRSKQNKRETLRTGVRKGKEFVISTNQKGRTTERTVALPKKNLVLSRKLDSWLESTPKKGEQFESWSTSLEDEEIDTKEVYTFLSKKKVVWGGVPTDIYHVNVLSKGANYDADIKPDGTPIRGKVGGFLEMRAEPEATAKQLDSKPIDLMVLSSIEVDRNLGNAHRVTALTMEVTGLGDYKLPSSHRQQVRTEKGKTVLELKEDFRTGKTEGLTAKQRAFYLKATPTVQTDAEKVKKLAQKVVGDEKDPVKVARKIKTWVYRNLRKSMAANASTTLEVLDNMAGDCTEHTLLFVSLARAAGVPAREVGGVAFVNVGRPIFGWHAWAEFHDGEQWVTADPTWDELYVDATHIKFSEGDDMAWLNVLGHVKFKVVKFDKK
ncbi:MAG TPA: transglutaminase-like domain-containing protein [Gemmataceae bacterium]|nr:transglutaminase-like domain-containing protein [Gemmataceae bacterium]